MQKQNALLEEEERRYQEQLEQERQDRELALRLAQESNGQVEDSPTLVRKWVFFVKRYFLFKFDLKYQ